MPDATPWIEHLTHPLVLVGFIAMLICAIGLAILSQGRWRARERVVRQALSALLVIAVLVVGVGLATSLSSRDSGPGNEQVTHGDQSPAIVSDGGVNVKYGSKPEKEEESAPPLESQGAARESTPATGSTVQQKTSGDQSPAVVSEGDVKIQFGE